MSPDKNETDPEDGVPEGKHGVTLAGPSTTLSAGKVNPSIFHLLQAGSMLLGQTISNRALQMPRLKARFAGFCTGIALDIMGLLLPSPLFLLENNGVRVYHLGERQ